jgi:hypothetical protein
MRLFGFARSAFVPRAVGIALALAMLIALPGCWVYSIEPLYEEHQHTKPDPDLSFDQSLLGSWGRVDEGCEWTLTVTASAQVYRLTVAPGQGCKPDEKTSNYDGRLVKLDNHRFLDVFPKAEEVCELCLPLHSFFLLFQDNDSLSLIPLDISWMVQAINSKRVVLSHLPLDADPHTNVLTTADLVLTAPPTELKKFVRQYAEDKAAFKPDSDATITFKRKTSS